MEKEFLLIIEKASIQVTRTREREEGHVGRKGRGFVQENLPKQLTKMLQICFDRFRGVVAAHTILLKHFEKTKKTYKGKTCRIQFCYVYHVNSVLQHPTPYTPYLMCG